MPDSRNSSALEEITARLFILPPDEFIAARNRTAKEAQAEGHAELAANVRKLSKPSVAAWGMNLLLDQRRDVLHRIDELRNALATAQSRHDVVAMHQLGRDRRDLVDELANEGSRLAREARHPLSEAAQGSLREMLMAAIFSREAASALQSGPLVKGFTDSGSGADLTAALALPGPMAEVTDISAARERRNRVPAKAPVNRSSTKKRDRANDEAAAEKQRRVRAERDVTDREKQADAATADLESAAEVARDAAAERARLAAELDELMDRLYEVKRKLVKAEKKSSTAAAAEDRARRVARTADEQLQKAKKELDVTSGGTG